MADPFIGEIRAVGFDFAPEDWAICAGQLLSVDQNPALFALLWDRYGGDGRTTFALPDLRGRTPIGYGQGPGLSYKYLGSRAGNECVNLYTEQIPAHSHQVGCSSSGVNTPSPANGLLATTGFDNSYLQGQNPDQTMNSTMLGNTGGNHAHNNMQPYLTINYIIALTGYFPPRS